MAGEFRKTVLGVVTGTAICGILGWAVFALHDDYVVGFVMPAMVETSATRTEAPLIAKLDGRYMRKPEESTDDAADDKARWRAVEPIQKELRRLRHAVEELRQEVEPIRSAAGPAGSPLDPPWTIPRVRLYLSTVEGEEHSVVLNGNSPRLAEDVRYGAQYGVSLPGGRILGQGERWLRAELRSLDAPGQVGDAAIGRVPKRYFDALGGRTLGYVVADLHLLEPVGPRP